MDLSAGSTERDTGQYYPLCSGRLFRVAHMLLSSRAVAKRRVSEGCANSGQRLTLSRSGGNVSKRVYSRTKGGWET